MSPISDKSSPGRLGGKMSRPLEETDPNPASDPNDAAVEAYMTRGENSEEAGDGEDAAPEAAQPREFKYRGKAVKVDADTYELLESLKKEARGANGRLGSELARLREQQARLEGMLATRTPETQNTPEIKPPDPLLATRDIAAWQAQWDAYHAARMEQYFHKVESDYSSRVKEAQTQIENNQREKEYADRFYSTYDHLDSPDLKPLVAQVYTEHKAELEALSLEEQHERLAELADARLLRVSEVGRGKNPQPKNNRPPRVESSAGAAPGRRPEAPAKEFTAASWSAKQRAKMFGREVK